MFFALLCVYITMTVLSYVWFYGSRKKSVMSLTLMQNASITISIRTIHTSKVHTAVRQLYSRSYAEDVTSVTSGASQGPHSFNLVFVCLFVCLCHAWRYPVAVPYRTVPSNTAGHIYTAARNIQIGLSNARS